MSSAPTDRHDDGHHLDPDNSVADSAVEDAEWASSRDGSGSRWRHSSHTTRTDRHSPADQPSAESGPGEAIVRSLLDSDHSATGPTEQPAPASPAHTPPDHDPPPTRRPLPSHRADWLDRLATSRYSLVTDDVAARYIERVLNPLPAEANDNDDRQPFVALYEDDPEVADSHDESEEQVAPGADMPGRTGAQAAAEEGVVDLTLDSPPLPSASTAATRKRRADGTSTASAAGASNKRARIAAAGAAIEEVDLAGDEASIEATLAQARQPPASSATENATSNREEANREQEPDAPQRIGKRSCVICMEAFTNVTATHCGHFYCHECLLRSVIAAEKVSDRGTGNCPICRKTVSRSGRAKNHIIPISFMTRKTYEEMKVRRVEAELGL